MRSESKYRLGLGLIYIVTLLVVLSFLAKVRAAVPYSSTGQAVSTATENDPAASVVATEKPATASDVPLHKIRLVPAKPAAKLKPKPKPRAKPIDIVGDWTFGTSAFAPDASFVVHSNPPVVYGIISQDYRTWAILIGDGSRSMRVDRETGNVRYCRTPSLTEECRP